MTLLTEQRRTGTRLRVPPAGRPHLRDVLVRVAATVVTAVVVPAAILWAVLQVSDFPAAVIGALAWTLAAVGWRWATHRPVSGLLMLTSVILALRTALALATGSTFLYFVQPVFSDLTVAALFLGSLCCARPLVSRLAPDFCPMNAEDSARPEVRLLFRRLTLMWGLVILVKASVTLWLLNALSTSNFILIKGGTITLLTLAAAVVTIVWAAVVGQRASIVVTRSSPNAAV